MTFHRLNPRGYTWQTYLRKTWFRLVLVLGYGFVLWQGTALDWYTPILLAVMLISTGWDLVGRHVWQGWRSK